MASVGDWGTDIPGKYWKCLGEYGKMSQNNDCQFVKMLLLFL